LNPRSIGMSVGGDDVSELSWLKGDTKSSGGNSPRSSSPTPKARGAAAEDKHAPSWLFDDNDDKSTGSSVVDPEPKKAKYAQPKNKKRIRDLLLQEHEEEDSEEDCCFGCCHSDPLLLSFQLFHFASGMVGLAALAANVYTYASPDLNVKIAIVRAYTILFCLLIVIVEVDWRYFVNRIRFVEIWLLRGLFYVFVALLTGRL
jgi:hypothetical protein